MAEKDVKKIAGSTVRACACSNGGQDRLHGRGMRVHNFAPAKGSNGSWRCTVCANEKSRAA